MFCVIEGLDGTGKSTLARLLLPTKQVLESPAPPWSRIVHDVRRRHDPYSSLLFFLAANSALSRDVARRRGLFGADDKNVLVVRYVWSTLAYHSVSAEIPVSELLQRFAPVLDSLRVPDFVVLVRADRATVRARLAGRNAETREQRAFNEDELFQERVDANFAELRRQTWPTSTVIEVDTTSESAECVAERVRELTGFA